MATKKSSSSTASKSTTSTSTSSSSTTTSTKKSVGFGYIMSLCAYVSVVIAGLGLFIAMILSKVGISATFTSAMQTIANAIGWAVLCLLSAVYISHRRKIWMWAVWAVAVVMIIIGIIL